MIKKSVVPKNVSGSGEVHLRIDSPLILRKQVLSSAVDVTRLLKNYETYKLFREKRLALVGKLDFLLDEIKNEFENIQKQHLPKLKDEWVKMMEEEDISISREEVREVVKVKEDKPKKLTEVEKINKELEDIEAKLAALS